MKILELRFKNLNSLYGEWVIDFTHPEYASNGLFALTGPTGAGKSTILDAICLALYGATPRLGKITKGGNEIMSRQTGECYAEVLFESQAGRFRCHWEQRRARKRAEGKLQDQEHQIADATGKPLETKKSLVGKVIEEKTGMDFDRFTRSILLAQGGFDTFLKADVEQKSKILEQITGTEIYTEISKRVHERQREEQEKLNLLNAETSGIEILEPEQERAIQEDLAVKEMQEAELIGQSAETEKAIAWLSTIENLKTEILSLEEEAAQLKTHTQAFEPSRLKLEQGNKAAALDGLYANLTSLRQQQTDDQASLKSKKDALSALEITARSQAESLQTAEQLTLSAKEEREKAAPLIQKIRLFDQRIAQQRKAISESMEACTNDAHRIEENQQARAEKKEEETSASAALGDVEQYLQLNAQDEWLIGGLAGVDVQFNSLLVKHGELRLIEASLQSAHTALDDATKNEVAAIQECQRKKQALETAGENRKQAHQALSQLLGEKLLREYRQEKDYLLREKSYIKTIEKLEEQRAKLEDGRACPLCGSIEHPFAKGNVPVPDKIDLEIEKLSQLIEKAEAQESLIKELEQAEAAARQNLNVSERQEAEAVHNKASAEKRLEELKSTLATLQGDFEQIKESVLEKLRPLGIHEIQESELESLLNTLKSRLLAWQTHVEQKRNIENQMANINREVERLDAVIGTQVKELTVKQANLEQRNKELAGEREARTQLYGDKNPEEEEDRLNNAIADAELTERKIRNHHTELQQKLTTAQTQVESLNKRIEQRTPELEKVETDFSTAVMARFTNEHAFLQARLSSEERESLTSQAKELDDAGLALKTKQKDREARLATERSKKCTNKTLEELEPQFKEFEESLETLRHAIAGIHHKLRENASALERIKEQQSAIESQKKECQRWEKLHSLIGSSDGKKYRNFAQGLTFERMVSHANRQLEKMTDRYLLIRDEHQPLELNVIDHYQAGEIRSTKNLSGGESFIVSLTLALGLSKMASRKVRVDSLFLDEGFGTLDEEALETALETLSGLQQDGKLIGIISHVSALKERIRTQISIAPISSGRSSLFGPGCSKEGALTR